MRILKVSRENIGIAASIVKQGGLVVFPTDTVYGLGCDPFNVTSVKRLISIKGARDGKPLPILAASLKDVEKIAKVSDRAKRMAGRFWPGALTIVLPKREGALPNLVTSGLNTVGTRVPNHKAVLRLIRLSGGLLIGTSANKSGHEPAVNAENAREQLNEEVDVILTGATSRSRVASTVVDMTGAKPKILRTGSITLEES